MNTIDYNNLHDELINKAKALYEAAYKKFTDRVPEGCSVLHCEKQANQSVREDMLSLRFAYAAKNKYSLDDDILNLYQEIADLYN